MTTVPSKWAQNESSLESQNTQNRATCFQISPWPSRGNLSPPWPGHWPQNHLVEPPPIFAGNKIVTVSTP